MAPILHMGELSCRNVLYLLKDIANTGELGLELRVDAKDMRLLITVPSAPFPVQVLTEHRPRCLYLSELHVSVLNGR